MASTLVVYARSRFSHLHSNHVGFMALGYRGLGVKGFRV